MDARSLQYNVRKPEYLFCCFARNTSPQHQPRPSHSLEPWCWARLALPDPKFSEDSPLLVLPTHVLIVLAMNVPEPRSSLLSCETEMHQHFAASFRHFRPSPTFLTKTAHSPTRNQASLPTTMFSKVKEKPSTRPLSQALIALPSTQIRRLFTTTPRAV